ncbi:MarR family transcriptional regulator [Rhodococcus sovatensis]|uniref:MarR family transcriptional regulator n=1 Tax=Rhodococcus sovatensis TaxID=1805840 RepID=A0ABZ2PR25_9NOCA
MTTAAEEYAGNVCSFDAAITLLRMADVVRARLEASLDGIDLSWARYELLNCLARRGPMTFSGLAHALVRHRTSIATTTSILEDAGLVARFANPQKPQQYLVRLTRSGQDLQGKAYQMISRRIMSTQDPEAVFEALHVVDRGLLGVGVGAARSPASSQ